MNTVATAADFLTAIIAQPEDDTHRLVYADWLSEHGEEERGEFIRVQCELHRLCIVNIDPEALPATPSVLFKRRRILELTEREDKLGSANYGKWEPWVWKNYRAPGTAYSTQRLFETQWSRGFIATVGCTSKQWLAHGNAIATQHPLESVTLSDWEVVSRLEEWRSDRFCMQRGDNGHARRLCWAIPLEDLGLITTGYSTPQVALAAFSATLIAWARLGVPVAALN